MSRWQVLEGDEAEPVRLRGEDGRVLRVWRDAPLEGARWLGTLRGEGLWGTPDGQAEAAEAPWIELESPAFDEIGVAVGPDRDGMRGLFDAPTTEGTDDTATREHTDIRGDSSEGEGGAPRRTAVLAWIAATPPPGPLAVAPAPCEPLKRRIADEPLDVVPALDGLPVGRGAPPAPVEHEDTATQIEGFEAAVERPSESAVAPAPPREVPRVLLVGALVAALAALVIQLVWG